MPSIEIMGISNPDESGDGFRKQWEQTINLDAIDNIEIETAQEGLAKYNNESEEQ